MPEGIRVERRGKVAVVIIDRPQRRNTFNQFMFSELERVTADLAGILPRAIVITGVGDAFSAGFDVNFDNPMVRQIADSMEKKDPSPAQAVIAYLRRIMDGFTSLPVPTIAALNGLAYGGGAELAVQCDMRVIDPAAVICFSEVRLGLMPDWGGGATLARLVGPSIATDLVLTGRKVGAEEALKLNLVNRVSHPGQTLAEALAVAEQIAENGPRAIAHALELIRESRHLPLREALELESRKAVELIVTGECVYGIAAFLEKKKPEFPDIG